MSRGNNVVQFGAKGSAVKKTPDFSSASLARLPAPVHRCRELVERHLKKLLPGVFDAVDDALFDLADNAVSNGEQNLYFESMRELRLRRHEVEKNFLRTVEYGYLPMLNIQPVIEEDEQPVSLEGLSLVADEDLERQVAVDAMAARQDRACAEQIQHLSMRFDALVPGKVYQGNNPVTAEALCKAFSGSVAPLDVDIKAQLVLLKIFDKQVMTQHQAMVAALNAYLIDQHILPSLSGSAPQRQSSRPSGSTQNKGSVPSHASLPDGIRGDSGQAYGAAQPSADNLLAQYQQLIHGISHGASTASSHTMNPTSPSASSEGSGQAGMSMGASGWQPAFQPVFNELQHHILSQPVAQSQLVSSRVMTDLLQRRMVTSGVSMGHNEQDVVNLVSMLFEFILDDKSLAVPMKALLGRLQIPLVKVALLDKSFFGKNSHPARRLLNEMATAAIGWQVPTQGQAEDGLFRAVNETVRRVLDDFDQDVSIFGDLLTEFRAYVEKEQRRARIIEKRTLDAEQGKAAAAEARGFVSQIVEAKLKGKEVPEVVSTLLRGPWSNLLFLIALKDGQQSQDWQDALSTAEDLIWSVTASIGSEERKRLLGMLPNLLKQLREGMNRVSHNPFETTQIFKALEVSHLQQLKGGITPKVNPGASSAAAVDESSAINASSPITVDEAAAKQHGLSTSDGLASEQTASMDALEEFIADQQAAEVSSAASDDKAPAIEPTTDEIATTSSSLVDEVDVDATAFQAEHLQQVDQIAQGSWLDMVEDDGARSRCRLAAIIRSADKFIFVNRNGVKVAEKTRTQMAQALAKGKLVLLENGQVFERALESIIGGLRRSQT